jgi:hypothetical protein
MIQNHELCIVVVDGLATTHKQKGYSANVSTREVVREVADSNVGKGRYNLFHCRGGLLWFWDTRLEKYLLEQNHPDRVLLCVGRSSGCAKLSDVLLKLDGKLKYVKKAVVTVDPFHISDLMPHDEEDRMLVFPSMNRILNVYQRRGLFHGKKVVSNNPLCHPRNIDVSTPEVTHSNIIYLTQVSEAIKHALTNLTVGATPKKHSYQA